MEANVMYLKYGIHYGFQGLFDKWDPELFQYCCGNLRGNCKVNLEDNSVEIFSYKTTNNGVLEISFEFADLFDKYNVDIERTKTGVKIFPRK